MRKENKLNREELEGKLGAMYAYAIAHMQEMGVSEGKRKEFAQAHREMKSIIKQHFEDAWHIINVKKELGQFYGKPVPKEKVDGLVEKWAHIMETHNDLWSIEDRVKELLQAYDNLREGKKK